MSHGLSAIVFGGDDRLHPGAGELVPDRVGVIPLIGEQGRDPVSDHEHQRAETLGVVQLAGRQDESKQATLGVAPGVEPFGRLRRTLVEKPPRDRPGASSS